MSGPSNSLSYNICVAQGWLIPEKKYHFTPPSSQSNSDSSSTREEKVSVCSQRLFSQTMNLFIKAKKENPTEIPFISLRSFSGSTNEKKDEISGIPEEDSAEQPPAKSLKTKL